MNDNAWERLVDTVDVNLGVTKHSRSTEPIEDHPTLTQQLETIEFERGGDRYKLVRTTGPAIIDRKSHFSHRAGTANRVEYVYDESEIAHKVTLHTNKDGEWTEIDITKLGL